MRPAHRILITAALMLAVPSAQAIDFRSVATASILYDAPSNQGKRLFIIAADTPVELISVTDRWARVRDAGGAITWIDAAALSDRRTVQVSSDRASVRQSPDTSAPAVLEVTRDVVLELRGTPANGWVQVAHRDGIVGHIRVTEVWGL